MAAFSLLSNAQKTYVDSLFDIPFNTWKRPIRIITVGNSTVVSTDPNYDHNYKNQKKQINTAITEQTFDATVEYSPTVTDQMLAQNPNLKAKELRGLVRISIEADGAALIKKNKEIQFDGHTYEVETSDIPRGMFETFNTYDFWLIRKN